MKAVIENKSDKWILKNNNLQMDISKVSGLPLAIYAGKKYGAKSLWGDAPAGLTVYDGLNNSTVSLDQGKLKDQRISKKSRQPSLSLTTTFPRGSFSVCSEYVLETDNLSWSVSVIREKGPARTTGINFVLPWPASFFPWSSQWHIWAADGKCPVNAVSIDELQIEYGDGNSGSMLPAVSVYNAAEDFGLTVFKPFEQKVPRLRFKFDRRCRHYQAEYAFLRMKEEPGTRVTLQFFAHAGDWRPALGMLYQRYADHFIPPNKSVCKLEGPMLGGRAYLEKEALVKFKKHAEVKWEETYAHFPCFGNYFSETEPWIPGRADERPGVKLTYESVRQHIRDLHDCGIAGLLYWQASGDGHVPFAKEKYPESIVKQENGQPIGTDCYGVYRMNGSLNLPFGKHLVKQAKQLLEKFPEADGLFVDQVCYNDFDFAHDDGFTMINNKPCYSPVFVYEENLKVVSEYLAPRDKVMFGNGPDNINAQRYLDGIMAESTESSLRKMQYYALAKPLVMLVYGVSRYEIEHSLRLSIEFAVAPGIFYLPKVAYEDLYSKYLPLIHLLKGRRWVFNARPLELPEGVSGNIFKLPDGRYAVTMVPCRRLVMENDPVEGIETVTVRLPGETAVRATLVTVAGGGEKELSFKQTAGEIIIETPFNFPAGVILIKMEN